MCNNRLYCRIISYDRHGIGTIRFIAGNIPHNGLHESGLGIRIGTRSYIITGIGIIDTVGVGKRPRTENIYEYVISLLILNSWSFTGLGVAGKSIKRGIPGLIPCSYMIAHIVQIRHGHGNTRMVDGS